MSSFPVCLSATGGAGGTVRVERPMPRVAVVTLDRPDSLNALDGTLIEGMVASFGGLANDPDVAVVIVTGAGRGFSSGADLSVLAEGMAAQRPLEVMRYVGQSVHALAAMPQLTIAAVNGPAVGAGWGVAMACDVRIAGPQARFGATFVRMGLGPDYGLSATLPRAVGRERALELLMTGRFIDAAEAARIGVVAELADCALTRALALAGDVASAPARAIRSVKATLRRAEWADIDEVVDQIEAPAQAALFEHPDFLAGAADWMSRHRFKQSAKPTPNQN